MAQNRQKLKFMPNSTGRISTIGHLLKKKVYLPKKKEKMAIFLAVGKRICGLLEKAIFKVLVTF